MPWSRIRRSRGAIAGQVGAVLSAGCDAGVEGESADEQAGSDEEGMKKLSATCVAVVALIVVSSAQSNFANSEFNSRLLERWG
jgi:hypothetical protein